MRILFAGTPQFAASALVGLVERHQIVGVLTQPDRPSGRGMQLAASPVKQLALRHGLNVFQPVTLKDAEVQQQIAQLDADVMVVAAYGLILPSAVLRLPRYGCLNIHASLLPRWRGAAPIQRAILAGDAETGITIMQMDAGLDTGAMLLKKSCPICAEDNSQSLHDTLAALGAQAIGETLELLQAGKLRFEDQDNSQATYAAKLSKNEARLDWQKDAQQLERAVRAYYPTPTAFAILHGIPIKIARAQCLPGDQLDAGKVIAVDKQGIRVACGQGMLELQQLQKPGGKMLPAAQFVQGFPIVVGDCFDAV